MTATKDAPAPQVHDEEEPDIDAMLAAQRADLDREEDEIEAMLAAMAEQAARKA